MPYYVLPAMLTSGVPYPYGGATHAETILESCLAVAEQRLDDSAAVHSSKYRMCLEASVMADRRHRPQLLGYNGDRSDGRGRLTPRDRYENGVTYNGVQF
jgi:hypothetical protein